MSKQGPLEGAIELLGEYSKYAERRTLRKSSKFAIRVLEAAGKVDKHEALAHMKKRMTDGAEDCRVCNQIRALLESLPDEAK